MKTDSWRELSEAMKRHPAVFVLGVPRSGTTVLRNTIARLPEFRAAPRSNVETRIFVAPERVLAPRAKGSERILRWLNDDAGAADRLAAAAAAARESSELTAFPTGATPAHQRFLAERNDHLVRLFFGFGLAANGAHRVLEKTPRHMYHLDEIRSTFPAARVLMCVRHPVDVYSSYRKKLAQHERNDRFEPRHQWLKIKPKLFGERFAAWAATMLDHEARDPATYRVVRYETLTADPRAEVARVCEFIGVRFEPEVLFDAVDEQRDRAGSPLPSTRLTANAKKWRDHLSESDARKVEVHAASALDRLGYPRVAEGAAG